MDAPDSRSPVRVGAEPERLELGVAATCSQCARPIVNSYLRCEGQTWCPACAAQGGRQATAHGYRPWLLACLYGALAATGAATLWALIVILTGYQLGLVAVVIGIVVGLAVRKGSGGTGGRRYQVLAMALTMAALAYASVPIAIAAIRDDPALSRKLKEMWAQAHEGAAVAPASQSPVEPSAEIDGAADSEEGAAAGPVPSPALTPAPSIPAAPSAPGKGLGRALLGLAILVVVALLGPFVLYVLLLASDPFSLLFLGIALWEAWRFSRAQERAFSGPFAFSTDSGAPSLEPGQPLAEPCPAAAAEFYEAAPGRLYEAALPRPVPAAAGSAAAHRATGLGAVCSFAVDSMRLMVHGLTRPRTALSMAVWVLTLGWLIGWERALGFAGMVYVHEMGHLILIRFFGFRFSWPFFVPFLGAFVLQGEAAARPREDATISLAGPAAGMAISAVLFWVDLAVALPAAVLDLVQLNAVINLMNLLPFWILDGGRLAECSRRGQILAVGLGLLVLAGWPFSPFTLLLGIGFVLRAGFWKEFEAVRPAAWRPRQNRGEDMGRVLLLTMALIVAGGWMLKALRP